MTVICPNNTERSHGTNGANYAKIGICGGLLTSGFNFGFDSLFKKGEGFVFHGVWVWVTVSTMPLAHIVSRRNGKEKRTNAQARN